MLSTGRLLTVFFVAAFKKFSRKRRAIIFNNAITIRGRCLSCKIPTAGKALGHSGKWDANIQDYLFLKIPESNNNNNHCSEQCIKWLVCYCLKGALGSPAKGPVQTKHRAGDRRATWGLLQAPPIPALPSGLQKQNWTVWQPQPKPSQVKAGRKKKSHLICFYNPKALGLAGGSWYTKTHLGDALGLSSFANSFSKFAMRSIIHGLKVLKKLQLWYSSSSNASHATLGAPRFFVLAGYQAVLTLMSVLGW